MTLIGVVTGTKLDKHEERIAWLLPLVDATGNSWKEITDPEEEFPERGYVFWPHATVAEKGHFFFHAKENPHPKEGGDEYTAVDARPVFEVLDLRASGTPEQVREALSSGVRCAPSVGAGKCTRAGAVWAAAVQAVAVFKTASKPARGDGCL